MKKLLFAPFLLASLFSFGGGLKANPVDSNLNPTPLSTEEVWQMIKVSMDLERRPLGWGDNDCSPKIIGACRPVHRHTSTNTSKFAIDGYRGVRGEDPMLFTTQSSCRSSAMALKSFYQSNLLSQTIRHYHNVRVNAGVNGSRHDHNMIGAKKIDFKYICIRSTSEEIRSSNASSLPDRWYLKLIDVYRYKYPVNWSSNNCSPKKANGSCKRAHSHPNNFNKWTSGNGIDMLYFSTFSSRRQCQETATKLQNFVRNLNLDGFYEHDHGNSNFYHTHVINQKYEPTLKHICLKAKGN